MNAPIKYRMPQHKVRRPIALPLSYQSIRPSKSGLDGICSKLRNEVASLRREVVSLREAVASLQAAARPKAAPIDAEKAAERDAGKRKRAEEREVAKQEHAAFLAKQAPIQAEKARTLAEWQAKDRARQKAQHTAKTKIWAKANPDKIKASHKRQNEKRKALRAEARKAKEQMPSRPDLLGGRS
jgi:hypothetical protein